MATNPPYADNVITGTIGVDDTVTGKDVRDVTPGLWQLYPQNRLSPMLAVLGRLPKGRTAFNPKIELFRKDIFPRWDTITSISSGNGTSAIILTPANIDYYRVGDEVEFPKSDTGTNQIHGVVTAASTTITVTAIDGSTSLPTVAESDPIHIISDASQEYSTMPTAKVVKDATEYNYVQFLRYPFVVGNITLDRKQYTGPERSERKEEQMKEIKMSFERALIFGDRAKRTKSGTMTGVQYFMRGLKRFIQNGSGDNILDWSGGLTEAQFDEFLVEGPCKWGNQMKFLFASSELFLKLNQWAKSRNQITQTMLGPNKGTLGLAVLRYIAPNGTILNVIHHHMLEEQYEGAGLLVDPEYVRLRPYGTQGVFQYHSEIQAPDAAGIADEWRILASLEVLRDEPNAYIHQ
jgi:hypothetical protein